MKKRGRQVTKRGRGGTIMPASSANKYAFERILCSIQLSIPPELQPWHAGSVNPVSASKPPPTNLNQSQTRISRDSHGGARGSQEDSICMDAKTRGQRMKLKELTEPIAKSSRISSSIQCNPRNSISVQ